jgi:hypothetical protein
MNKEEAARVLSVMRDTLKKVYLVAIDEERVSALESAVGYLLAEGNNVPIKQPDPITGLVPCDFCTDTFDQKPLLQENKYEPYTCMMSTISIEENNGKHQIEIDLWDGGNVYAAFEINYCPMCGRKLTAPSPSGAISPEQDGTALNGDEGERK